MNSPIGAQGLNIGLGEGTSSSSSAAGHARSVGDRGVGATAGQAPRRNARACLRCRKLKKTCDSVEAPCGRCRRAGVDLSECVFDRPASDHVDDAGLARLSSLESQMGTVERRLETVISTLAQLVQEVSTRLPLARPSSTTFPASPVNFHSSLGMSVGSTGPSAGPFFGAGSAGSPTHSLHRQSFSEGPSPASTSRLPSQPAPRGVDNFASNLQAPIRALAEAAAAEQARFGGAGPEKREDAEVEMSSEEDASTRPAKRAKTGIFLSEMSSGSTMPDLVSKGLISDKEARGLVNLWFKELLPMCAILDPEYDTYHSLRQRSPFLFNTICYTALRGQIGSGKPSKELIAAASEARKFAQSYVFHPSPSIETIQSLALMACWHEEPYIISGHGMRAALAAHYDKVHEELTPNTWSVKNETTRHLSARLRVFLYLCFLEFRQSRSSGRMILLRQVDVDHIRDYSDTLLRSPFACSHDVRTVANLKLSCLERDILQQAPALQRDEERVAFVHSMRQKFAAWHELYDGRLALYQPDPLAFARRSQLRHHQDSLVFLACNVFKQSLLDPTAPATVRQIARESLEVATLSRKNVLGSPLYRTSLRFNTFLTRVDLTFLAVISLKLANLCPGVIDSTELINDVRDIIELLSGCLGSQTQVAVLRAARDEFLERAQDTSPVPFPAAPTPALDATRPAWVPPASTEPLPPWAAWSAGPSVPANVAQALMPGEIDWQLFGGELSAFHLPADPFALLDDRWDPNTWMADGQTPRWQ